MVCTVEQKVNENTINSWSSGIGARKHEGSFMLVCQDGKVRASAPARQLFFNTTPYTTANTAPLAPRQPFTMARIVEKNPRTLVQHGKHIFMFWNVNTQQVLYSFFPGIEVRSHPIFQLQPSISPIFFIAIIFAFYRLIQKLTTPRNPT